MRSPVLLAFLLAAIMSWGAACADSKKGAPPNTAHKSDASAEKVKDPICGMTVDPKTAEKTTYEGKTYYFCSREEKVEFDKNPAKYTKKR